MADSITIKILSIVLFSVLISQGYSQCSLKDISVSQQRTGVMVQGKPEWKVTVTNKCACGQKNVILNCDGFQTVEPLNPLILTVSNPGPYCLVTPGYPIYRDPVTFNYAWDVSFPLNPISSQIIC
ncbi:hypothetical protein RJT34_03696 [Clitoria ternatea]|uniref:Uncharacterized protein n=1 Tax=Clitoria ternatea TaxID=43366 RepID=A0AAN9KK95_CLITE